jgi:hypothetical protein
MYRSIPPACGSSFQANRRAPLANPSRPTAETPRKSRRDDAIGVVIVASVDSGVASALRMALDTGLVQYGSDTEGPLGRAPVFERTAARSGS